MNAQWLLGWWNLVFIVPFGLALLYLGVYTLSGWTFGDADADHDVDADADVDVDVDADADVDADIHADIDADADVDADADLHADVDHDVDTDQDVAAEHDADTEHDAEHDAGAATGVGSALWSALSFLGVGTVPVSIVMMILLLTWGGTGFAANQLARESVREPWQVAIFSLPIAALASLLITAGTSRAIDRFMPLNVTSAKRRHELLGSTGEVILPIDAEFGMASVRDDNGNLFQVPCRLEIRGATNGQRIVPKGARVKLVAYSARESLYYVLPDAPAIYSSGDAKDKTA